MKVEINKNEKCKINVNSGSKKKWSASTCILIYKHKLLGIYFQVLESWLASELHMRVTYMVWI